MTLKLSANLRTDLGRKADYVRQAGKIPAVVYGHKTENANLEINYVEFEKVLAAAGESTIIDLEVNGKPLKALISEVQYEPVKGRIRHVDFHQVNMKEKIHATIQLKFEGEPRAVKEDGAVVIHNISEVEVRALPGDLVHEITVDISTLNDFDDSLAIKDIKVPQGIEILHHEPEDVVVLIAKPKEEKEEVAPVVETEGEAKTEGEGAEAKKEEDKK